MAAARRAAARAAAAEPPPPPAEPIPEPEPETKEPEVYEKSPSPEDDVANLKSKESISKEGKVTERIIERIIICPGCQPMPGPPPMPPQAQCLCPPQQISNKKGKKGKKKGSFDEENLCKHPYCIVQRARTKPQGLPWASGLYPGPPQQPQQCPQQKPPVVICQRPVICCCRNKEKSDDSEDEEEEDAPRSDTEMYMTFMNMVFAASNVMNERRDAF